MSRTRRAMTMFAALLIGIVASASGAQAYVAQNVPAAEGEAGRLVLVLDSSGSMEEPDASGQSKIEAARTALGEVIGGLPAEGDVGMRVFGATVFSRDDPGACEDSQLVVPVEGVDKDALRAAVDEYEPYGETPIAYSLQQAADDLGGEGQRSILLVSDGEETCDVDPCVIAEQIVAEGIDLRIDVVGLHVDDAAREQLSCIADRGNGTYYDVGDADEFTASLEESAARALQPFEVTGTPIEGTPEFEGAPLMETGAQYVDTVPAEDTRKYYTVERSSPGSNVIVGLTGRPGEGTDHGQVGMFITTADGQDCGSGYPTSLSDGAYALIAGSVSTLNSSTLEPDHPCNTADELQVYVEQTGFGDVTDTPFQIRTWEYSAATNYDALPAADDGSEIEWAELTPDPGNTTEAAGGASLEGATELEPGASYSDTVVPGEMRIFRVPVEWGQRLQAQVDVPPNENADPVAFFGVQLLGPTGANATASASQTSPQTSLSTVDVASMVNASTPVVRYRNLENSSDASRAAATSGDYYIAVAMGADPEGDHYEIPFTLTTSLEGEAGEGEPTFDEVRLPGAETPDDSTEGSDDGTSGEPTTDPSEDATEPVAGDSGDDDELSTVAVVAGLAGLALLLGGGYGIYRFTRS